MLDQILNYYATLHFVSTFLAILSYFIAGLVGILAVFLKENSINFVIFRTNEKQSSKYLMASVYAFGGGSLFMAVVNLFSYAHCKEENSHIVFSVFHFAHILSQMLFLQRFSLAIFRRSVGFVFLMFHIFGTNISICILYLTEETQIYKYNPKDKHHDICKENNGVSQMAETWSKFMAPFSIEFCLICAGMIYSMVNSTKHFPKYANRIQRDILHPKMHESLAPSEAASTYSSLSVMGETEHNARTYWEKQVMLEKVPLYSGAHPGFLAGLTVAVIMTVSGLAVENTKDVHDSLLFHHIYLSVVSISQIISIAVINRSLKNHEYVPQNFRSDDTLMVISFAGLFAWELMCLISVMNGMKEKSWLSVVIFVHNLANLITCMVQCRVIIRTLRFRNRIQSHKMHLLWDRDSMVYTMSRLNQSVVYLLMTNIGFWVLDSFFEIKHFGELFYPTGIEFYNKSAWDLMSAMLYPLGIFFRFHSVILLFEIWARFGRHARSNACKDVVEGRSRKNSLPPIEFVSEGERAVRKIRNAPSRDYADIYRQHWQR